MYMYTIQRDTGDGWRDFTHAETLEACGQEYQRLIEQREQGCSGPNQRFRITLRICHVLVSEGERPA